jgi:hypothetical protein
VFCDGVCGRSGPWDQPDWQRIFLVEDGRHCYFCPDCWRDRLQRFAEQEREQNILAAIRAAVVQRAMKWK